MLTFNCGCSGESLESVGPKTEEELLARFPDAAIILVLDENGNTTPLKLSKTIAENVRFPLAVTEISEPPTTLIAIKLKINPPPMWIGTSGGSGVLFHRPHHR
jgi:hypothetical protein